MFSQEMLNSSFEPPKRSPRSVNSNNIAPPSEIQVFNVNYENPASFGFRTGNNSTKFLFKGDESQPYDFLSNRFFEKEVTPANTEPVVPVVELNIRQVPGLNEIQVANAINEASGLILNKLNMNELENLSALIREKKNKNVKSEVTSIDVVMPLDGNSLQQKLMEEEKRKSKNQRQKVKKKKRSYDDHKSDEVIRSDLDMMLDKKAREVLERYFKQDTFNSMEDATEGKFAPVNGKIKPETVKFNEEELSLLQDIKEQISSKDNVEKVLESGKEIELKPKKKEEAKHMCEKHRNRSKDNPDKSRQTKPEIGPNQQTKFEGVNKETFLSTDDENEIKKFSEFLSKNKNAEEKRKCLEEVRNYFEKKRTRQVKKSDEVQQMIFSSPIKKDVKADEVEKKAPNEQSDEVVEKAVSETLQKFTELYRFEIPQNVIQDMKKSIIKTIQSENQGQTPNRKDLDGISLIFELKDGIDNLRNSSLSVVDNQNNKICVLNDENNLSKEVKNSKKNPFKTVVDPKNEKDRTIENNESGHGKELIKEFEHCLESIKTQVDITGAKLCSVIFEKTDGDNSKKAKLVYNFKKADSLRISYERHPDEEVKLCKNNGVLRNSVKIQTVEDFSSMKKSFTDKNVQTKEKKTMKISTQTEWKSEDIKETGPIKIVRASEGDHVHEKSLNNQDDEELLLNIFDSKNQPVSKEFSQSDKGIITKEKKNKKLERSIKSDCLGINKQPQRQNEQKKKANITSVNYLFLKQDQTNTEPNLRSETKSQIAELHQIDGDLVIENELKGSEKSPGCVWLWNGKKIDPGCDLKVQVEELMKEKIKEMLEKNKSGKAAGKEYTDDYDSKTGLETSTESFTTSIESSERNLEVRKVDGKFCFSNSSSTIMNGIPFVFTADNKYSGEDQKKKQSAADESWEKTNENPKKLNNDKKYREVGTQNAQQNSLSKLKGKISRKILKNSSYSHSVVTESKSVAVAKKVSDTKKAKLEVEKEKENAAFIVNEDSIQSFSTNSNPNYDSLLSNTTDNVESEEQIPAETVHREEKNVSPRIKIKEPEFSAIQEDKDKEKGKEKPNFKQWEFIESVLNKVNHKEKENLWDDIRDFVKTKIGRDINDEGAREVCIEIEQDLPKQKKGKNQPTIIAKGNYARTEGDIEVEVDLTLEDLERILKHRQKKLRRRQTYTKGFDTKQSINSAALSSNEEIQKYQTFLNSCKALGGDYITESELNIIKDN